MKENFNINKMMKSFCFLCKKIETLIDCKIIHHDLHFGNIMYDYTKNNFVVIDFGLAIIAERFYINNQLNMPYLNEAIFRYTPTWQYFAIEEHLLSYLIHKGDINEYVIKTTIDEYLSDHIIQNISPEYCKHYREESYRYFKKFINKPRDIVIKKFLSWWSTWDYYKISLHNIKLYSKLKIDFPQLYMLLLLMIHPIPKFRPNVVEMNKNIQILLNSYSPKVKYIRDFDDILSQELSRPLTI